jgi:hypothetical protein
MMMVGGGTRVRSFFPVRDLSQALAYYRAQGFDVTSFNGDQAPAMIKRSGIVVHLVTQSASRAEPPTVAHVLVGDAHALAIEWSQ